MDLLLKRAQTGAQKVKFRLWAKIETTEEEVRLIERYSMRRSELVFVPQPRLWLLSVLFGAGAFFGALLALFFLVDVAGEISLPLWATLLIAAALGGIAGFLFFNEQRETIMVSDMLSGRNFKCRSVIELARKEAFLEYICEYFRQVLESAKHWDGVERIAIEPLPPAEAKRRILSGPLL